MHQKSTSFIVRTLAWLLVFATVLPLGVGAAVTDPVQPMASDYLNSYNGYISTLGDGKIRASFTVTATAYMDTVGALRITIYESTDNSNWTLKKTYLSSSYTGMMASNKLAHSGGVDYQGVVGRYYRAYIGIWAGKNGAGDSRYFYTASKRAT